MLQSSFVGRRGFHLLDLCVLLAVAALLLLVGVPHVRQIASERSDRIKCAANLRNIAQHGFIYANQDRAQKFPRTYFDASAPLDKSLRGGKDDNPTSVSFNAPNPAGPVGANNVQASFYLLLKSTDLTTDVFICPSTEGQRAYQGEDLQRFSNWPASYPQYNSYSYNCPFPTASAIAAGWKFDASLGPDYAFAADINPGDQGGKGPTTVTPDMTGDALRPGNSPNHWFDGQNIAFCDGHVEWQTSPFSGGKYPGAGPPDNIYASGGPGAGAGGQIWARPVNPRDAVLLPTVQDNAGGAAIATRTPDMSAPMDEAMKGALIVGSLLLVGVVVLIIWLIKRKKTAPAYMMPPGAYPPGVYPPGVYPPGAYPPGAYPPGAFPPGAPPPQAGYPPQQGYFPQGQPPQGYSQQGHPQQHPPRPPQGSSAPQRPPQGQQPPNWPDMQP